MTNVLKRIISALIIISSVIQLSGFNLAYAAGDEYKDPYKTIYLSEYDGEDVYLPADFSYRDGFGSNTQTGHYVSWKNVKFDESPVSVELSYGTMHQGAVAEIRLDSVLGPVIATFTPEPTGKMYTEGFVEVNVQNEVTGVHDLYFVFKNNYLNIKYLKFKKYGEDNLGYSLFEGMSDDTIYEDLSVNALSYEIKLLNKLGMLGFIEDTKFDGKKEVTKADFAVALCGFYTDKVENDETYFYDLPALHTKAKYVNYIYQKGLFEMTPDKHFRPDDVITVEQAFDIIKKFYIFPDSDDKVIEQTKKNLERTILSGVTGKMSDKLTRQNLAKMLSNTIEATYIKYITGLNGKVDHYFTDGILKQTRNLDKTIGLVSAVPSTSLSNVESGLEKGKVLIGDVVYEDPNGLAQQYLGYNCVVFYEKIDDELNIEAIYPKKTVSETIIDTTKDDELLTISEELIEYSYPDLKGKTKKIKLAKSVYFVYNGKAIDDTIDRFVDVDTFQGKIRIIDNKDCIAVLIDEYQNVILKSINAKDSKYLDRITEEEFDFSEDNLTVYHNQRPIMSSDIPEESAAYIYQSKNTIGQKITRVIIIPDNKITGTVTSVKDDIIKIDSEEYKIAKENPNIYSVGLYRTFVVNTYNEVIWSDTGITDELTLGLFLGYKTSEVDEIAAVKIYANDGTIKYYECAERFILDGVLRKKLHQIENGIGDEYKGLADVQDRTPVMYLINSDNKLAILDTYHEGRKTKYDNLIRIAVKGEQAGQKYRLSNRSRILVKQETGNNGYGAVPFETNFTLISLWKGIDEAYNIIEPFTNQIHVNSTIEAQAYSTKGNNKIADLLVCTDHTMNIVPKISDFILVDEVIDTLDKDDVPTRAITGYTGTEKVTQFISHQLSDEKLAEINKILNNLKRGDYIYVAFDPANNITDIQVNYFRDGVKDRNSINSLLYKKDIGGYYRESKSASLDAIRVYCKVADIEDNFMFVEINDGNGGKIEEVYALSSPAIFKVYPKGIETGLSIKEVFNSKTEHGANAVVLTQEGIATQIIIYE